MLVTLLGIVTEVKPEQPEKAYSPIFVTVFGMLVFLIPQINVFVDVSIIALQLFRLSNMGLLSATVIDMRSGQLEKLPPPMYLTSCGI